MAEKELISKLLEEMQIKINEIKEIYGTLQTLKKYGANFELPEIQSFFQETKQLTLKTNLQIRPDQFVGLTNTDAVEQYLKIIGRSMPLDDIFQVLTQGGVQFSGDGKRTLYVQLMRATRKFRKIGKGENANFGLIEFYPKKKIERVRRGSFKSENENQQQSKILKDNEENDEK